MRQAVNRLRLVYHHITIPCYLVTLLKRAILTSSSAPEKQNGSAVPVRYGTPISLSYVLVSLQK